MFAALLDPLIGTLLSLPQGPLLRRREARWNTPRRRRRGLVVILGGIEGPSLAQHAVAAGLLRGRWRGAVVVHRWNGGVPLVRAFVNLMSRRKHERAADELLAILDVYRREQPGRPLHLLAVSGGCWVAIRMLEKWTDHAVETAVLLAPAVSADVDLTAAAGRCRRGVCVVRSPLDFVMLGLGTLLFGTSDRRHAPAAGLRGFRRRPAGVTELSWRPEWMRLGHFGGHCTAVSSAFIAARITPLLNNPGPSVMRPGPP